MEVYALVGKSGTGKSHRAMIVAYENDIDVVVDDGLLIKEGQKLAGVSAKGEATALKAVKRAILLDPVHAEEIRHKILELDPSRILILGTSLRMVERIARTLGLPDVSKVIHISQVASEEEMQAALNARNHYGMHVIPMPVVEVKRDLPGYFMNPIRYFFGKTYSKRMGEKTIIRPRFSWIGKLVITNQALTQIIRYLALQIIGIAEVNRISSETKDNSMMIKLDITGVYGMPMDQVSRALQAKIQSQVLWLTGLVVAEVHVLVKYLTYPAEALPLHGAPPRNMPGGPPKK
jgi:uncharacterized alkaline shock family protein YloU